MFNTSPLRAMRWVLISYLATVPLWGAAQSATAPRALLQSETYVKPPSEIAALVTAPWGGQGRLHQLSPDRRYVWRTVSDDLPSVQALGRPYENLAGLQVDVQAERARALSLSRITALAVQEIASGKAQQFSAPQGATWSQPVWSPDGARLAVLANFDRSSQLYVIDMAHARMHAVPQVHVLPTLVTAPQWSGDGKQLYVVTVPEGRKAVQRPAVAHGPQVRMTRDKPAKTRVLAALLKDPADAALFQHYTTGQLVVVDVQRGTTRKLGAPAMISQISPSPQGDYVRVTRLAAPFSYWVRWDNFARRDELWNASGQLVATLTRRALRENLVKGPEQAAATPDDAAEPPVLAGLRSVAWLPDGSGISYLRPDNVGDDEDPDDTSDDPDGNSNSKVNRKDTVYVWRAPFAAGTQQAVFTNDKRITSAAWTDDMRWLIVSETEKGSTQGYAVALHEAGKRYPLWTQGEVEPRSTTDDADTDALSEQQSAVRNSNSPGRLLMRRNARGVEVVHTSADGRALYFAGKRYYRQWEQDAPRAFVNQVDITSGEKTVLFESQGDMSDTWIGALDNDLTRMAFIRESTTAFPNTFVWNRNTQQWTQVSQLGDPAPAFTQLVRKRVWVTRPDGFRFLVNVTLPANYTEGTRLPTLVWIYPREYANQAAYDRSIRNTDINQFPRRAVRTMEYLATQGYAVANLVPPIVGPSGRMNDNYVQDLKANLEAVVDTLHEQGLSDRNRMALGGHSYGAFSTVNGMVHTQLFKAGIAGAGMYNRTLTPYGFQNEKRDIWAAQKMYLDMSPLLELPRLSGALLLYHGMEDENPGTNPISSRYLMHSLMGQGKTAALYLYPYEDHGPAGRENLLDMWARWVAWLDVHVKNSPAP